MIITIKDQKERDIEVSPSASIGQLLETLSEIDNKDLTNRQLKLVRTGDILGKFDHLSQHGITDGDILVVLPDI